MNTQDLKNHFGTLTAAAKALGTSIQVVSAWNTKDRIPPGRQFEIQILTGGKLQADPQKRGNRGPIGPRTPSGDAVA
jgi:hypothetical protein